MKWLGRVAPIREKGVLDIGERKIPYIMSTHRQARRIKLIISGDGTLRITVPPRMGREIPLRFVNAHQEWIIQAFDKRDTRKHIPLPPGAPSKKHYSIARSIVLEKIQYFNEYYNHFHTSIRIKDIRTKWGSCSSKGNLNFNYKLQFLPTHLIDYIIVHELCHLKEMNHGKDFWNLVVQCIPDAVARKKELLRTQVY